MNKVKVRCWIYNDYTSEKSAVNKVFATYPEDNNGHELITCLSCGEIYAVTVVKKVYIGPPLVEKIKDLECVSCGKPLSNNIAAYPDTYIQNGKTFSYKKSTILPPDEESVVKEFYGIYE